MIGAHRITRSMPLAVLALLLGRAAMLGLWKMVPIKAGLGILVAMLTLDVVVLLAQLWLIQRARRSSGTGIASFLLALSAILVTAFVLSTDINRAATSLLRPPPPNAPKAVLLVEGPRAYLRGDIGFDSYNAVQETLAQHAQIAILDLDSTGGRIAAARGIARLVRENTLDTHVSGTCASACTLILIAGQNRSMSSDARIGFHGYRLNSGIATVSASEEQERDKSDFVAKGVTPAFLDRALAVPHEDMWFPSASELRNAGILTD